MEITDIAVVLVQMVALLVVANRYITGVFLKIVKGDKFDQTVTDYEPTVTIVVPMFNEGQRIYRTIQSLANLTYPKEKLSVIIVDDCSTDDSNLWAAKGAAEYSNVIVTRNPQNMGKRKGICRAVRQATSEIIVSVDSDVELEPNCIEMLVRRFVRPSIAAVGGRVNLINCHENWLTKMQAIKYFFGYEYVKNVETAFKSVLCLSGCLTAYRRHVLLELEPILEDRQMFGIPIKYGEDRFLTRMIVKAGYETTMTLDAISYTMAPSTLADYFSQQLRWRRSNIVDYMGGMTHVWKLNPFVAINYIGQCAMLFSYPLALAYSMTSGGFFRSLALHLFVLMVLCAAYYLHARTMPERSRVSPIYFMPMAAVMPVTYLVLIPLALFTLDSGSWETRGHGVEAAAPLPSAVPTTASLARVPSHRGTRERLSASDAVEPVGAWSQVAIASEA